MNYLLDTNACIALINGEPAAVRQRLRKALRAGNEVYTSTVVTFELWYGVEKSFRREQNGERLTTFLAGPVAVLPFEQEDAQSAGTIRAALEKLGKPIGAYDTLIAGQALRQRLTLVTANLSEFSRVHGLLWQDWAK